MSQSQFETIIEELNKINTRLSGIESRIGNLESDMKIVQSDIKIIMSCVSHENAKDFPPVKKTKNYISSSTQIK